MSLRYFNKWLAGLSVFACTSLFAAPLVVDLTAIESRGLFTDPGNTVLSIDVGANSAITAFSYTANLTAITPSLLSEIGLAVSDSGRVNGFFYSPAVNDRTPGTGSYGDAFDLTALDLAFNVGADGILRIEFYENVDSRPGVDGLWNFGTLTFEVVPPGGPGEPGEPGEVPEPASLMLLAAGLGAMAWAGRRRALAHRG